MYFIGLDTLGQSVLRIDSLPASGVVLNKGWKWHSGDNPMWAKPDFDDSHWDTLNPVQGMNHLNRLPRQGIGWLRIRMRIAPNLRGQNVGLNILQAGATQVFINEKLVFQNGKISLQGRVKSGNIYQYNPLITLNADSIQVIAVRYAFSRDRWLVHIVPKSFLRIKLMTAKSAEIGEAQLVFAIIGEFVLFGVFLFLGLLQLLLYAASKDQRSAFSLGLFLVFQSVVHIMNGTLDASCYLFQRIEVSNILPVVDTLYGVFIIAIAVSSIYYLLGIYQYFGQPRKAPFWIIATITFATIPGAVFLSDPYSYLCQFIPGFIIPFSEILRVGILAIKRKQQGAKQFTYAHSFVLLVFISWTVSEFLPFVSNFLSENGLYLFSISFLALGLTISLLLAQERAAINKILRKQLFDLDILSRKTISQEQEKQHLLATQNERLEQQVESRTAELRASQAQLIQKEKLASLGELTAGIAHEIQNPLNFVNNFSEVSTDLVEEMKEEILAGNTDDLLAIADYLSQNLQKITLHGGRASSIVKGMLEHSRTGTGERQSTDLNALTNEYLRLAYHGLMAKNKNNTANPFHCELISDFDPDLGKVDVVPQEIGRVLLNLYNNAFYAVKEREALGKGLGVDYQPAVWVSTKQFDNQVEILVRDNGTGIPESVKAKIFQPFFTTKPTGEGTGLGLSLSYDIITKGHGGALHVNSTEGEGTEFTITLPVLV